MNQLNGKVSRNVLLVIFLGLSTILGSTVLYGLAAEKEQNVRIAMLEQRWSIVETKIDHIKAETVKLNLGQDEIRKAQVSPKMFEWIVKESLKEVVKTTVREIRGEPRSPSE